MNKKIIKILSVCLLVFVMFFMLASCGAQDEKIDISIDIAETIEVGETKSFDYTTTEEVELDWSLSSQEVLSIDVENKEIKGLQEGRCTITITGENVKTKSVVVKVVKPEGKNIYTITYVLDGGQNSPENPTEYTEGQSIRLKEPTKSEYKFLGWYTEDDKLIEKIEKDMSGNITLYAKWEELQQNKSEYRITYNLNGGNWKYASYQEVVEDLLNDYNTFGNTNYTSINTAKVDEN